VTENEVTEKEIKEKVIKFLYVILLNIKCICANVMF
jgi:hypothetical protein